MNSININSIRDDFAYFATDQLLSAKRNPIYLDNAATTQKPHAVVQAITDFYQKYNAPIHRGIYAQAEFITSLYESARVTIAQFIDASPDEIVFTSGTTEGINFIAQSWALQILQPGDEIMVTELEHHSNLLPWYRVAQLTGSVIRFIPITQAGDLDYNWYESQITSRTKLLACTSCSNAIGTQVDVKHITSIARQNGTKVLLDIAQTVGYQQISMRQVEPDFAVFSGHKMVGPTGIGVLYITGSMQDEVEPYQLGGGMVQSVTAHDAIWAAPPRKYEAGTPPVAQAIGLAAACDYLTSINYTVYSVHYNKLMEVLIDGLKELPRVKLLGPLQNLRHEGHVLSFTIDGIHSHDVAAYLDTSNIAVRAGNHCAQPLFTTLSLSGSVRVSLYLYNTIDEITYFIASIERLIKDFC